MSISPVLFQSTTDLWETPQDLFDKLNEEFHFNLDACAIPENAKCEKFFTLEQDGLKQEWEGTVWCNPPYGKTVGEWVAKAYQTSRNLGGGGCDVVTGEN